MQELDEELPPQPAYPAPNTATPLELFPPTAAPPASSDSGVQPAVIAGGAAAGAFLLCVIAVCCVLWLRRRRRRPEDDLESKPVQLVGGVSYEADMTTTGGTDRTSLPSGKITRAASRGAAVPRVRFCAFLHKSMCLPSPVI